MLLAAVLISALGTLSRASADEIKDLQTAAVKSKQAPWGHWGPATDRYSSWTSHSNRLIPVYTFGVNLDAYRGEKSAYRNESRLAEIYGRLPESTLNPAADYLDQTDIYRLQLDAAAAGKKHIILFVFDGMDWQTTWAAAIHRTGRVAYREGRGTGLAFQDTQAPVTDFGYFVSSPYAKGSDGDVDAQTFPNPQDGDRGGYDSQIGGPAPWSIPTDPAYPIGQCRQRRHAVTDSSSSATSLTSGIKTYNAAVNVDPHGKHVVPVARLLQEKGFAVGVVTSVPISHATPASAYSNNVDRDDFQDLTRDLVGLRSISHRETPLPGVDVLIGAGWGVTADKDPKQGANYVAGNKYLADDDLPRIDLAQGGKYRVAQRTAGASGKEVLAKAAGEAAAAGERLFGFFGVSGSLAGGHLPFATADGGFDPAPGNLGKAEVYTPADISENPTLADMATAALTVLERDPHGFWLMIEPGDVDWANHDNNVDNSIGAVKSGDAAFQAVIDWVQARNGWQDTAIIVTADHGHYLVLDQPEALAGKGAGEAVSAGAGSGN